MKNFIYLIVLIFTVIEISTTNAQIAGTQIQKVDSVVTDWNNPDGPGGVIEIMSKGGLEYLKPFGLSSLDYDIPIGDDN